MEEEKNFSMTFDEVVVEIKRLEIKSKELQKERENYKKRINLEIEEESNKFFQKCTVVNQQKDTILQNRKTLKDNIYSLDSKKYTTVLHCFEKVNHTLGQIFAMLLPGANARMKMDDYYDKKKNIKYKGIEMEICFNNQWKNSLSELSGGQRSLLALSFLLSLLKYNSAPFYIFDEVDAALDLSHTENLGLLIAKHFSQSQFLVISLKEGFFNNSNVLYKTSHINGSSMIERIDMKARRQKKRLEREKIDLIKD